MDKVKEYAEAVKVWFLDLPVEQRIVLVFFIAVGVVIAAS